MFHEFAFTRFTNLARNQVESWEIFTSPFNYDFNSGEMIEFYSSTQFERLFESFEIAPGVTLPVGEYRFTRWGIKTYTASKRRWSVGNAWWFGPFWSGRADQIDTSFQYKLVSHFQTGIMIEQTFAHLPVGNFVARLFILKADYSVSPLLTFFNLVLFDTREANLAWQSRVRWILRPGNDVFLVFTQGWVQDEARRLSFRPAETRFAGKVQYTFRF